MQPRGLEGNHQNCVGLPIGHVVRWIGGYAVSRTCGYAVRRICGYRACGL